MERSSQTLLSASRCLRVRPGTKLNTHGKIRISDLDSEVGLRRRQSVFGGFSFWRDRVSLFRHAIPAGGAGPWGLPASRSTITACRTRRRRRGCRASAAGHIRLKQGRASNWRRQCRHQSCVLDRSIARPGALQFSREPRISEASLFESELLTAHAARRILMPQRQTMIAIANVATTNVLSQWARMEWPSP
jgi:hypothetical protein